MAKNNLFSNIIYSLIRLALSVEEKPVVLKNPRKFIVIRQHNQFGDLLASVSLFRAIKESFPESELSVVVSPENYYAVTKNEFINRTFLFDKSKLLSLSYLKELKEFLSDSYDAVIVPATVSVSTTSCILSRFVNAKYRIGPASLGGKNNPVNFLFNARINLDWGKHPDAHVSDFSLDIVRPFGMETKDFSSKISFDKSDSEFGRAFILEYLKGNGKKVFGFHVGAGKPPNRWSLDNFASLISLLREKYGAVIYLTGSSSDKAEIDYVRQSLDFEVGLFLNNTIPQLAALIDQSDLFITNDTGVMHVAGTTDTPQVSLFGPTNPFNWAPIGSNKRFIRKSELINDITVEEVLLLCNELLNENNFENEK